MPLVTIGLPVHNGAKYLHAALEALLGQTQADFEIIISDNASTDSTQKICEEFNLLDSRITYIRQAHNIGAAENFNYLAQRSNGKYFMWAAYDDLWAPNYLAQATSILRDPEVGFIFPEFCVCSINYGIHKRFNENMFKFIESKDRAHRIIEFLSLHHDSHKCNIVYSLFKREILISALAAQDISNDGVLGAVILGITRGKILNGEYFKKRYPTVWPGFMTPIHFLRHANKSKEFDIAKSKSLKKMKSIFPQYEAEITSIFDQYKPFSYNKGYRICRPTPSNRFNA